MGVLPGGTTELSGTGLAQAPHRVSWERCRGRDRAFRNDGAAPRRVPHPLRRRVVNLRVAVGYSPGGMSKVAERLSRACAAALVRRAGPTALVGHRQSVKPSLMESIVNEKLAAKSMTVTQRAHWLGAQLVVSKQPEPKIVERFAAKHENAMTGLFAFFESRPIRTLLLDRLSSRSLGRLARLLCVGRRPPVAAGSARSQFRESDFVARLDGGSRYAGGRRRHIRTG